MKVNFFSRIALPAVATIALTILGSCSQKGWHAEGSIAGGENKDLVLEAPNGFGGWYSIDTVTISDNGKFSLTGEPAGHPEVYRLTLNDESLYFPIDSLETITIEASAPGFATNYTLSGSPAAERMQKVNDAIAKVVANSGEQAVATDSILKRVLADEILSDPAGIVAYYTIFRRVGNTLLFDPTQKADLRMIGAVANAYANFRPTDPRTKYLSQVYISGRSATGLLQIPTDTIQAQEIQLPEVSLLDADGKRQVLSKLAAKGNVIVLNFTAYSAEGSPAFNLELAKVYNALKTRGMEIYQVSFDTDEFFWKQAARNLPWITVYNSPKDGAENLIKYNVGSLPALFIIDRKGDLVERVENIADLKTAVSRYL